MSTAEVDLESGKATLYLSPGTQLPEGTVVEAVERTAILRPVRWLLAHLGKSR